MKKVVIAIPILLLVIVLIFLWAIFFINDTGQQSVQAITDPLNSLTPTQSTPTALSASQKGVDLTIDNIKRENNQTIIELSLNNHIYDLSQMDAKSRSSLAGVSPSDYKIIDSASGGHHLQAQMIFNGNLTGPLVINLGDLLTFNFNI